MKLRWPIVVSKRKRIEESILTLRHAGYGTFLPDRIRHAALQNVTRTESLFDRDLGDETRRA